MKKSVSKEVRRKLRGFINRERGVGREPTISRHQTGERFKKLAHSAYIDPRCLREFLIKNPEWECYTKRVHTAQFSKTGDVR